MKTTLTRTADALPSLQLPSPALVGQAHDRRTDGRTNGWPARQRMNRRRNRSGLPAASTSAASQPVTMRHSVDQP